MTRIITPDEYGYLDDVILQIVERDYTKIIPWTFILNSSVFVESGLDVISGVFYADEFEPLLYRKFDRLYHPDKVFLRKNETESTIDVLHIPHTATMCAHLLLKDGMKKKKEMLQHIKEVGLWEH